MMLLTAAAEAVASSAKKKKGGRGRFASSISPSFIAGKTAESSSSLSYFLCQPLLNYLQHSRSRNQKQSTSTLPIPNSSGYPADSHRETALHEWIDDVWEEYLIRLKTEIEQVLEEKSKERKAYSAGFHRSPDHAFTSGKVLSYKTSDSTIPMVETAKNTPSPLQESSSSGLRGPASETSTVPVLQTMTSCLDDDRELQTLLLSTDVVSSSAPHNRKSVSVDYALQPSSSSSKISRISPAPVLPVTETTKEGQHALAVRSSHAEERTSQSKQTKQFTKNETENANISPTLPKQEPVRLPRRFVIPAESYRLLSERESSRTVMARLCGDTIYRWFASHTTIVTRFSYLLVLMFAILTFSSPWIPQPYMMYLAHLHMFISVWVPLYFSAYANWSVTASTVKKFEFIYISCEVLLFILAAVCMQYVIYSQTRDNAPAVMLIENEDITQISLDGSLAYFFHVLCYWSSIGLGFLCCLSFCDGFPLKLKATIRYVYLAIFTGLFVWLTAVYVNLYSPHRLWVGSYFDLQDGLNFTEQLSMRTRMSLRIPLFDFWFNRGIVVCIFGMRVCLNAFVYPKDFVFIKGRIRIAYATSRPFAIS